MTSWLVPVSLRELCDHFGIKRVCQVFERVCDQYAWNYKTEKSFVCLRMAIPTLPLLAIPSLNKKFVVEIYATWYSRCRITDHFPFKFLLIRSDISLSTCKN